MQPLQCHITKLKFNNGTEIALGKSDIVVFVGPNNSGKSRSLKDIYDLFGTIDRGVVISEIETNITPCDDFDKWIGSFSKVTSQHNGDKLYALFGSRLFVNQYPLFLKGEYYRNEFRPFLFSNLATEDRLTLVSPPTLLDPEEPRTHPIQIIKDDKAKEIMLSGYFERAFGEKLCTRFDTKTTALLLGSIAPGASAQAVKETQRSMPQLHEQGDGMRGFAGIILNLIMPNYSVFFIDEPESFLHPPQARILGEVLPEVIPTGKQAFIATHSQDLLKGLIEKHADRVKIIRVTRSGNTNTIKLLDNAALTDAWKDSLLKYSNLLDALFHHSVVVCEGDGDCKVYSMVLSDIKEREGDAANVLFSYCGGKMRFATVARLLKALGVEFRIVADLDFLNQADLVKKVYEICGGTWTDIERQYNVVKSGVDSLDKKYTVADLKKTVAAFLDGKNDKTEISKSELETFKGTLKYPKGWDRVKKDGISAIPGGDATKAFHTVDEALRQKGIFMPHVGELENFIKTIGGHGPGWVQHAIEAYPTLPDADKRPLREFIASLRV